MLLASEDAWVTPDSISMTYEALSAGCRTGVFELSPNKTSNSRITHSIEALVKNQYVRTLKNFLYDKQKCNNQFTPQANDCAKKILKLF